MKVFYIITTKGCVGCMSRSKLEKMYISQTMYTIDISEFKGHLLGSEWLG
jgi:hypothetical protein